MTNETQHSEEYYDNLRRNIHYSRIMALAPYAVELIGIACLVGGISKNSLLIGGTGAVFYIAGRTTDRILTKVRHQQESELENHLKNL